MGKRKIQNETEVDRWFEEGLTYQQMVEKYLELYNIETSPSMWGNYRRRKRLERRIVRDDDLIPWAVKPEHRWIYPLVMLRVEARRRAGKELTADDAGRLASWLQMLDEAEAVVHYDPDTEEGFFLVPRQPGDDLIHRPKEKTARPNADKAMDNED
ncbi:hypothetical protein [Streptomyces sp. NRRL F-5123]|uniref:hypothetical protein n=1 Tax=Streptomyces sp. NRRL F-5123 TaxID=1463856 RepID=UPI0004E1B8EE|nr:hypothetical protein [Streptomyces sp. NRRL F-5123]